MTGLDNWASTYGEAAQFIAFFGMIAAMGVVELLVPRARRTQDRKHRWPTNVVLTALTILTAPLVPLGIIGVAIYAHQIDFGLIPYLGVSASVALVLGLLLRSLVSYVTHLLMHKVPWFWRIHRVHHLDTHLDISTTVRFHPFETFVTAPITLGAVFLFGIPPTAAILYEVLDAGLNVITHANVRIPKRVDRLLGLVFMTPDLHRVHHSPLQAETDSNYCATLSIWDRLFGTLVRRDRDYLASSPIGLDECQDTRANSLSWLLVSPFRSLQRSD